MTAIFSSSALKTRQREVKDIAEREVVHITENGNGAFVFCSEDIFSKELSKAYEQALYDIELRYALDRADEDYSAGRTVSGLSAARKKADALREAHE